MLSMNEHIREAVRIGLAKKNWKQKRLAEETGLSEQYISQLMRAKTGDVSEAWQRIFDALELELKVGPKE